MGQLRLGEQAVQLPKLGGGQRIGGGIFHRYTRGCGKLLRLFAASQEKQGEQEQGGGQIVGPGRRPAVHLLPDAPGGPYHQEEGQGKGFPAACRPALEEAGEEQGESQHPAPQDQHPEGPEGGKRQLAQDQPQQVAQIPAVGWDAQHHALLGDGADQQEVLPGGEVPVDEVAVVALRDEEEGEEQEQGGGEQHVPAPGQAGGGAVCSLWVFWRGRGITSGRPSGPSSGRRGPGCACAAGGSPGCTPAARRQPGTPGTAPETSGGAG